MSTEYTINKADIVDDGVFKDSYFTMLKHNDFRRGETAQISKPNYILQLCITHGQHIRKDFDKKDCQTSFYNNSRMLIYFISKDGEELTDILVGKIIDIININVTSSIQELLYKEFLFRVEL